MADTAADGSVTIDLVDDGTVAAVPANMPEPQQTHQPEPEREFQPEPARQPAQQQAPADDPQRAITELRDAMRRSEERHAAQMAEMERRRQEAENHARQVSEQAANYSRREIDANFDAISGSLQARQTQMTALRNAQSAAMREGDWDKVAELNTQMATAGAEITNLEAGRRELEAARKAPVQQPAPRQTQQAPQQYRFDSYSSWSNGEYDAFLQSRTPQTAAWLRANPRYASDPAFRGQVNAAHNVAVARGEAPDSDGYFRAIEEVAGIRQPQQQQPETQHASAPTRTQNTMVETREPRQPAQPQQRPAPAAPVARSVPNAQPGRVAITLTEDEQKAARALLPPEIIGKNPDGTPRDPLVVYAQRKAEQMKTGNFRTETAGGPTDKSQSILNLNRV